MCLCFCANHDVICRFFFLVPSSWCWKVLNYEAFHVLDLELGYLCCNSIVGRLLILSFLKERSSSGESFSLCHLLCDRLCLGRLSPGSEPRQIKVQVPPCPPSELLTGIWMRSRNASDSAITTAHPSMADRQLTKAGNLELTAQPAGSSAGGAVWASPSNTSAGLHFFLFFFLKKIFI